MNSKHTLPAAAVMAACGEQGEYGKQRLFGALGWGVFSAVAGSAIAHKGIYAAFACHVLLALAALAPTVALPFGPLHSKLENQCGGSEERSHDGEAGRGSTPPVCKAGSKRAVERFDSALEARSLLPDSAADKQQHSAWPAADEEAPGDGCAAAPGRQPGVRYWAGVARLLRCPEAAIFLSMAVFMGMGVGNIEGYLFLFLDELGEHACGVWVGRG